MSGSYIVTIFTAMPGTPLSKEDGSPNGVSMAGHMWYQVSDGQTKNSYGFAPKVHGASRGPGAVFRDDTVTYQSPYYSRTMEITSEQYDKLREFAETAADNQWTFFRSEYHGATNSCVDFTWGAFKHAGFVIRRPEVTGSEGNPLAPERTGPIERFFEGQLQPARNKQDLQQLVDPVPGSPLNSETTHAPPERTPLQKLISGNGAGSAAQQAEAQRFKAQLGPSLGQRGMSEPQIDTLAAAAVVQQTRFADQGEVQRYLLSVDGVTIALLQAYPPLREFDVGPALERPEQAHWNEASALAAQRSARADAGPPAADGPLPWAISSSATAGGRVA